jgi:hypothetical protein
MHLMNMCRYACICMYLIVFLGMSPYVQVFIKHFLPCIKSYGISRWISAHRNKLSKRQPNHSKTALTLPELEHPSSGAQVTLCTTETSGLEDIMKSSNISNISKGTCTYRQIPTHTCRYLRMPAYTYTYMLIPTHRDVAWTYVAVENRVLEWDRKPEGRIKLTGICPGMP